MAATLTTLDLLLKNIYLPGLPDFVNKRRPISDRITKITDKKRFRGRKYIMGAKLADGQSTGWLNEGDTLPVADNATPLNMELTMKYHYAVASLSAQAMDAAVGDEAAFEDAVKFELDSKRNTIADDVAIQTVYGTGAGDIGQVSAYSSTTLTTIGQPTAGGIGAAMLRRNMQLQSWAGLTGGTVAADHKQVTSVNYSAGTAVVPASAGFVANDYLFKSVTAGVDPRNKATMGLGGIIDDGTRVTTIQNLSRTTYPELKANLLGNSGTLRPITEDLMDQLCTAGTQMGGGGGEPSALYSQLAIQRRMAAVLRADREYDMFTTQGLVGGYTAVMWKAPGLSKSIPWFDDLYVRPNEVLAPCESDLFIAEQMPTTIVNDDGGTYRFTSRTDVVEVWFRTWRQLGSRQFNNHSVLRDISHTA